MVRIKSWVYIILVITTVMSVSNFTLAKQPVTLLLNSHFVPAHEDEIRRQVDEWSKLTGIPARVDFHLDWELESKITAESEAGEGHDIVAIRDFVSVVFKDTLVDVGDVVSELEGPLGGALQLATLSAFHDGKWKAVPWYHQSFPLIYRTDYLKDAGYAPEAVASFTFDDFLEAATKLNAIGHPVGFPISMCPDSGANLGPIYWGFGGRLVDENDNVAVNSPETRQAIDYMKKLVKVMPPEVLSWDNAGNNLFILSGYGAATSNPPSIYASALKEFPDMAKNLIHAPYPKGPKGAYRATGVWTLGITKYSKNVEAAKDLVKFLLRPDNFAKQVAASTGYNQPMWAAHQGHEIWEDPALRMYEPAQETLFPIGWPGQGAKASVGAGKANLLYILPVMIYKSIKETSTDEAIAWAETELKRIFQK